MTFKSAAGCIGWILHSSTDATNPITRDEKRPIYALELLSPTPARSSSGEVVIPGWVPRGLARDLIDDNNLNPSNITDPVTDRVRGFTTKHYFQILTTAPTTPMQVRDALNIQFLPSGQRAEDVNNLFRQYHWE